MRFLIVLCALFFCSGFSDFKIVAVVDGEVVSNYDLQERDKWYKALYGESSSKEEYANSLRESFVNDIIMTKEAEKFHVTFSDEEFQEYVKGVSSKMGIFDIEDYINSLGFNYDDVKKHLTAQLLWQKFVQDYFYGDVGVSSKELSEVGEQYLNSRGYDSKYEFIKFTIPENMIGQSKNTVLGVEYKDGDIQSAVDSLQLGGGTTTITLSFAELNKRLQDLAKGGEIKTNHFVGPIESKDGYYLLFVKSITKSNEVDRNALRNVILNAKLNEKANSYLSNLREKKVAVLRK